MSALGSYILEKPKHSDDFEKMVECCAPKHWNQKFTLYGRSGQKQNGIDIYSDNWDIVIQHQFTTFGQHY